MKNIASAWLRLNAYLIDISLYVTCHLLLLWWLVSTNNITLLLDRMLVLVFLVFIIYPYGYTIINSILIAKLGGTIGKLLTGTRIVTSQNQYLSIKLAFFRNFIGYFIASLLFNLGFIWILIDKNRRGWHDMMADTYVVVTNQIGLVFGILGLMIITGFNISLGYLSYQKIIAQKSFYQEIFTDIFTEVLKAKTSEKSENNSNNQVLGRYEQRIFVSGTKEGYSRGGVISLATTDEPSVEIDSYNVSGKAQVNLYQADENLLLDYLTHDENNEQIKKDIDVSQLNLVTTLEHEIKSGTDRNSKLTLPLTDIGIWLLQISIGQSTENAFIVRSNIGAIVKEGDNEFIFWGQDLISKRSFTTGDISIYNLENNQQNLANISFDQQGIAKTSLLEQADIALIKLEADRAIIPINLQYLNYNSRYDNFIPKQRHTKYFIFTDRPIYQPGETIYFKSILRDDDDARYTIPSGLARVKIYPRGDEKEAIYDQNLPITADGTVHSEFTLADNATTGQYTIKVDVNLTSNPDDWYYWQENTNSFSVEYFRKPEYALEIISPKTQVISQNKASLTIKGSYFSGHPLANQKVKYRVYSGDYYEYSYFSQNRFSFSVTDDYRYGYWSGYTVSTDEITLNQQGEAEVTLDTKLSEKAQGKSQVYSIEAEFDDGSGNPAFARKNILVFSGEYGIYRKDQQYGYKVNVPVSLPVILVSHNDTNVSGLDLTAKLHHEQWIQYQEPTMKYPSYRIQKEDLSEIKTTTDYQGNAVFNFTPQKTGSYELTVQGKDSIGNLISKKFSVWVTDKNIPYYADNDKANLTIQTDKVAYEPTDTAHLSIFSNIPDRDVFLSFDRDRINQYQVVHITGNSAEIDVPLVNTDMPNIFATISSFADDWLDTEHTNIKISTDSKQIKVTVTPDNNTYGPSQTATVNIYTTDLSGNPISADTAIWAVDKALFELVESNLNNIFNTFWKERSLNTVTSHSLRGISVNTAEQGGCFTGGTQILMSQNNTKNIEDIKIGDSIMTRKSKNDSNLVKSKVIAIHKTIEDGYLIINNNLKVTVNHLLWVNNSWEQAGNIQLEDVLIDAHNNPVKVTSIEWRNEKVTVYNLEIEKYSTFFADGVWVHNQKGDGARTVFKNTAYWNPSVHTDNNGQAQIRFKLPDNLTTWVLTTVSSTYDTQVGQTQNEIVVTKDVIVRPLLPNILRVEDNLILSALVHNFTDRDYTFNVDLQFDSGEIKSVATHSAVLIKSKDQKQFDWDIVPKQENELSKLTFSAKSKEDKKISDIITTEIPVHAFGFWEHRGETGDGPKTYTIKFAPDDNAGKSAATLSLTPTLIGTLPTAMKYLIYYPYGCVEQTTSSFVPAVITKENPDFFDEVIQKYNIDEILRKGIDRLILLQQDDGGWGWWSADVSNPFITTYVVEYLVRARQVGTDVNQDMLDRARNFLEQDSFYNPSVGMNTAPSINDNIARTYALTWLDSEKGKKQLLNFENISADHLSLAVMANVKNGFTNPANNGLNQLIALAKADGDSIFWPAGQSVFFGSQDVSTALAIRAILEAQGDRNLAVKAVRFLTRNRKQHFWSNTFATAKTIQALVDFSKTGSELEPNYSYQILLDDQPITQGTVVASRQKIADIHLAFNQIKPEGSTLTLKKIGDGQMYSTLVIDEFHTDKNASSIDHGLQVNREYINNKGAEYSLAVGDSVTVKITTSGLESDYNYGVISDELPAGLIPINPEFKNEQYGQNRSAYYTSYGVSDREITETGMVMSVYRMGTGKRTYTYQARVVSEGVFAVPPVTASLMYAPETYGRSSTQTITISKTSQFTPQQTPEIPSAEKSILEKFLGWLPSLSFLLAGLGIIFLLLGLILRFYHQAAKSLLDRIKQLPFLRSLLNKEGKTDVPPTDNHQEK